MIRCKDIKKLNVKQIDDARNLLENAEENVSDLQMSLKFFIESRGLNTIALESKKLIAL